MNSMFIEQSAKVSIATLGDPIGTSPALRRDRDRKSPHPAAKVAGLPASQPACAPGGESKDSPSSPLLKAHAKSEVPSTRTIASLRDIDAAVDDRGAEVDAAADALLE